MAGYDDNEEVFSLLVSSDMTPSSTGWVRLNCTFCEYSVGKVDSKYCLGVNVATGYWHCFRCYTAGFLGRKQLDNASLEPWDKPEASTDVAMDIRPPKEFIPLYKGDGLSADVLVDARNYLDYRKVPIRLWETYQIGACLEGKYAYKIVIPVLDEKFNWKGFVARDYTDQAFRRHDNSPGLPRNKYVFNHAELYKETDEPLFVVEGIFDALRLEPNAVAVLGKPSDDHFWLLYDLVRRPLYICFDGDARREGWSWTQRFLLEDKEAHYVELPPKTDPGDLTKAEIYKFVKED